jgi:hypothetical protein
MRKTIIIFLISLLTLTIGWWFISSRLLEPTDNQEKLVFIRDIYRQDNRDFLSIDSIPQLIDDPIEDDTLMAGLEFLPVADSVSVSIIDRRESSGKVIPANWSFFKEQFQSPGSALLDSPFLINTVNNEVVTISEIVIP